MNIEYKANDGHTDSNAVTVDITVNAVNDAPIPSADHYTTAEDTVLNIDSAHGVLVNDIEPDGDQMSAVKFSDPAHGPVVFNLDGSFVY
ncbi:Ig-like domain-containing protein [Bathymodiolus japonicus methanotrophic gill symbiont]|uniref:Ig-like domain-containing protein n=1 Tax=Bathymodiolus japonicus methanotrophic gill symbiont TaxID=113269 RepID=UPI001C8EF95D|nr:Ig-like domain-containing protein [Bathymodiolus japonicus methanotrophic gill symbiont]